VDQKGAPGDLSHLREEYHRFAAKRYLFLAGCGILILILIGIATTLGSADLTIGEVYAAIIARFFPVGRRKHPRSHPRSYGNTAFTGSSLRLRRGSGSGSRVQ